LIERGTSNSLRTADMRKPLTSVVTAPRIVREALQFQGRGVVARDVRREHAGSSVG